MSTQAVDMFKKKIEEMKSSPNAILGHLASEVYELAEEVAKVKGAGGFEREFELLKGIVSNNKPFKLDLDSEIKEHSAWSHWTKVAIDAGVVEGLKQEQFTELLEKAAKYDDFVESFLFNNLEGVSEKQIAQLYLAQTISFYYVFDEEDETYKAGTLACYLAN